MYQMSQTYQCSASCSSFSSSYSSNNNSSPLEYIAQSAVSSAPSTFSSNFNYSRPQSSFSSSSIYSGNDASTNNYQNSGNSFYNTLFHHQTEYLFSPQDFLLPGKEGQFVGSAEELKPYLEEAFEELFHQSFPRDIKVSICNLEQFRKVAPHPSTIGLSINRNKLGLLSEIFVLEGPLARVMLTLGHELGHVLTPSLPNPHDEEAKAYSFSLAWMKIIQENNIAGMQDSFVTERPAENGLHNVAFAFVEKMIKAGMDVWEIYLKIINHLFSLGDKSI